MVGHPYVQQHSKFDVPEEVSSLAWVRDECQVGSCWQVNWNMSVCLITPFKGDIVVVIYFRFPGFLAIFYTTEFEVSTLWTMQGYIHIILVSGQSQTSSSDFLHFGRVYLTDVWMIELPDKWDVPPNVDVSHPGEQRLLKLMMGGSEQLTCTTINTSFKMEMGKWPHPKWCHCWCSP